MDAITSRPTAFHAVAAVLTLNVPSSVKYINKNPFAVEVFKAIGDSGSLVQNNQKKCQTVSELSNYHGILKKFPELTNPSIHGQTNKHDTVEFIEIKAKSVHPKGRRLRPEVFKETKKGFDFMIEQDVDRSSSDFPATTIADAFYSKWIDRFGVPSIITTDLRCQFESCLFSAPTRLLGVERLRITAYLPQSNGLIEECSLKATIMCHATDKWAEDLPTILLGLRASLKENIVVLRKN
ncbi:transposon Ty3-I Gag-Pol polyprotein [Nephila pilipes]|uniref:Transposon Ty3-I Gag-Pol polyprotein n=1 Tax=Nephila pilipes TaxID=299642 RepID=A0A8X6NNF5_NEPPI|nr:transposon Ty3-I Gag-Pol polyprotein [Nephila pilipes]